MDVYGRGMLRPNELFAVKEFRLKPRFQRWDMWRKARLWEDAMPLIIETWYTKRANVLGNNISHYNSSDRN